MDHSLKPFETPILCPNCLNSSLYPSSYNEVSFNGRDGGIRWTGKCVMCYADVTVEGAKSSVILDRINTLALQTSNELLHNENQALKGQLAKIKELVK